MASQQEDKIAPASEKLDRPVADASFEFDDDDEPCACGVEVLDEIVTQVDHMREVIPVYDAHAVGEYFVDLTKRFIEKVDKAAGKPDEKVIREKVDEAGAKGIREIVNKHATKFETKAVAREKVTFDIDFRGFVELFIERKPVPDFNFTGFIKLLREPNPAPDINFTGFIKLLREPKPIPDIDFTGFTKLFIEPKPVPDFDFEDFDTFFENVVKFWAKYDTKTIDEKKETLDCEDDDGYVVVDRSMRMPSATDEPVPFTGVTGESDAEVMQKEEGKCATSSTKTGWSWFFWSGRD
ncbi:hypothetical protein V8C42DRAFT_346114 [Trichoderma barbatum]